MKELLKRIDECAAVSGGDSVPASAGAEYPALFLYVGNRAGNTCSAIKNHLKDKLVNAGSILHAALIQDGAVTPGGVDFTVTAELPEKRGDTLGFISSDPGRLGRFTSETENCVRRLMMSSGFPRTNKCFLFIISDSDSPINALLPEFVILFAENAHIRVRSFLFVMLSDGADGYLNSAAFFRELEDCRGTGFSYDGAVMMREGQRISVHHDGDVFDSVFFLESYRSDMKFTPHGNENNIRIAALAAALWDRDDPAPLPGSRFLTAGISAALKPSAAIAHIMFKSLAETAAGLTSDEAHQIPVAALLGRETFSDIIDRVMRGLPPVSDILSVLPKNDGADPDSVRDTNVRNVLEYYGGADEEHFRTYFERECERLTDNCGGVGLEGVFSDYINKGKLSLSDAIACLGHDGAVPVCLSELSDQLSSDEEALAAQLDNVIAQPCPGLPRGLFSKPSGCDILASAVTAKYGIRLEILKIRMMKRLVNDTLTQAGKLANAMTAALTGIRGFTDGLTREILRELYDSESTLTDASAFTARYGEVMKRAVEEYERSGGVISVLRGKELYNVLMGCASGGTDGFAELVLGAFRDLVSQPSVREISAMRFDEELYERYRWFEGGKDRGWVDARLMGKLTEECRANLRYSVFQPENVLIRMGGGKLLEADDASYGTVYISDIPSASYEQLAVYSVPSADSAVYANECRKVYDKFVAENGDTLYIDRVGEERTAL